MLLDETKNYDKTRVMKISSHEFYLIFVFLYFLFIYFSFICIVYYTQIKETGKYINI